MSNHKIKIEEHFADAIVSGEKTFEVRKNDRNYQKGDIVEFIATTKSQSGMWTYEDKYHEIAGRTYEITYVLSGWGLKDGYVCFSIKEVSE